MKFYFDYGRRSSAVRPLTMASANAQYGTAQYGIDQWSSKKAFRDKVFGTGEGDTIAIEISHSVANQPVRVTMLAAEIRGAGETQGI